MKPIFEEERQFFLKKTGIELPTDCWRDGASIYLDPYCEKPLYKFKVEDKKINIKKDNTAVFESYKQVKLNEVVEREKERVEELFNNDVEWLKKFFLNNSNYDKVVLAYSGGKDSDVLKSVVDAAGIEYILNFANTTNDTQDTYRHVKDVSKTTDNYNIMNPREGFYQWIRRNNFFIPNVLVRNCCATFKEGQLNLHYNKNEKIFQLVGVRKHESTKRAKYEKLMDHNVRLKIHGKDTLSPKWVLVAPIVDWTDLDIWTYILSHSICYNHGYDYGFERCGCLICPYQSDYTDMLIEEFYPYQYNRWVNEILPKTYENLHIKENFKWTFEEFKNGKWKAGVSKEQEIIHKKPTKERIKQLAELKGCSEEIAEKYFNKSCCQCEKKLNSNEVGMNLKMFGRDFNLNKMLCKKCMCEKLGWKPKQFDKEVLTFRQSGCTLF